ncbi:hypothetical protein [Maritalea myrionectae]|uniref:hypothetical protein n=1 Tax=Maritalea myrionectae TaxID=454601 RepID=UPI00040865A6|nr:hypothetical protein [Maritalea myrionectae]
MQTKTLPQKLAELKPGDPFIFLDWPDEGDKQTVPGMTCSIVKGSHSAAHKFLVVRVHSNGVFETEYLGREHIEAPKRREVSV